MVIVFYYMERGKEFMFFSGCMLRINLGGVVSIFENNMKRFSSRKNLSFILEKNVLVKELWGFSVFY